MQNSYIDLHVHTTASDGTLSPTELVKLAQTSGLKAVAITDHDTIQGVAEAVKAGAILGVEVVPGVEISVDHDDKEMHILGYYVQLDSPSLSKTLQLLQTYRTIRNPVMIEKLQQLGFQVCLEEVEAIAQGDIIGRPHFAELLVQKGYVPDKQTAFDHYLGQGKPAYVKKEKLTPEEGIEVIRAAGGIPVLAHPKYLKENQARLSLDQLLQRLCAAGLQGIEAYYSEHTPVEEQLYLDLADKHQLLVTGGSDFHGTNKEEIALGIGLGNLRVPYQLLEKLKNVAG